MISALLYGTQPIQKLLNKDDYNATIAIIVNAFDIEVARQSNRDNGEKTEYIVNRMTDLYNNTDLHTFFVLASLQETAESLFSDSIMQNFILNYVERVAMQLNVSDVDLVCLINSVVKAVCLNKTNPKHSDNDSLVFKKINESLYIDSEILKETLCDNIWLVFLYILIVFFQQTEIYKGLSLKKNKNNNWSNHNAQ